MDRNREIKQLVDSYIEGLYKKMYAEHRLKDYFIEEEINGDEGDSCQGH
jgi:hypothetical protein